MAEGLLIAGTPIRVVKDSWREPAILYQGWRVRAEAGNAIDTHDPTSGKRFAECSVYWITRIEENAFRALVPIGTAVEVSGDLPGTSWTAFVDIGEATRKKVDEGGTLHWVATCQIEEV